MIFIHFLNLFYSFYLLQYIKYVNGYSNIRVRSEYSDTISEFEYSYLYSVPAFFVFFFTFLFSSKYPPFKIQDESIVLRLKLKVGNLPN